MLSWSVTFICEQLVCNGVISRSSPGSCFFNQVFPALTTKLERLFHIITVMEKTHLLSISNREPNVKVWPSMYPQWEHPGPAWSPPHTPSVYSQAAPPSSGGRWWQLGGGSAQTCAKIFAQNIARILVITCLWSPPTVCWPGDRSSAAPSPGDRTSSPGTQWTRIWNVIIALLEFRQSLDLVPGVKQAVQAWSCPLQLHLMLSLLYQTSQLVVQSL